MKKKGLFCLLLSILLLSYGTVTAVLADAPSAAAVWPQVAAYGRSTLEKAEQSAYDAICHAAFSLRVGSAVPLEPPLPAEGLRRAFQAVWDDWPQLYWLDAVLPSAGAPPSQTVTLRFREGYDLETVLSQSMELEAAAEALLENLPEGEVPALTAIYDRLLARITYRKGAPQKEDGTAYGGIVGGTGICEAYARSFQYLAQKAGFPAFHISGTSTSPVQHAWSLVEINGAWLYADPTWDDVEKPYCYHNYFLTESLPHTPAPGTPPLPAVSGGGNAYYSYFGYEADAGNPAFEAAVAAALCRYLADHPPQENGQPVFLEVRLAGEREAYLKGRRRFQRSIFKILSLLNEKAMENILPFSVKTDGSIQYNFNDQTQVLVLFPIAVQGVSQ